MKNKRLAITENRQQYLIDEVGGLCPFCGDTLLVKKGDHFNKNYEVAHIYPLNPTLKQAKHLHLLPALTYGINDINNLIAVCLKCHKLYDNSFPNDYETWIKKKRELSQNVIIKQLFSSYTLEEEISEHIILLMNSIDPKESVKLDYKALTIDQKIDDTLLFITKQSIKNAVVDYYEVLRKIFIEIDKNHPNKFETLCKQVNSFYTRCTQESTNQEELHSFLVEWFYNKTGSQSRLTCQILVAFFVQNCEIYS